jgi:Tn3 transposase DDE domain
MNADLKRKLPEDAPTDFIPKRLWPLVMTDGKPDRKAWECALLLKLQDDLRSGNLSVKHGKRFGRFEDYFLPKERWEPLRDSFFQRSGLAADAKDVPGSLTKRLNAAYDLFLKTAADNSFATADGDGWHLSKDVAETLDAGAQTRLGDLRKWLAKHMRTVRLPDLLIEVDNDLRLTDHFLPPAQRGGRDAEDVCRILAGLEGRADRTIEAQIIVEQWDRMGQFYASLERGHTTASVALKRLASCTAKNRFYRANRDLGRIFKTKFLLSYLSEPPLRSRIRRGLLKVEQLHALARDVYYGRRGRINARELHEQMNSCSCLTLILACVIYWQAKEISRVVRWCQPANAEDKIDIALLEHISPIEWDNIILYGQYVLDRSQVR